MSVTPENAPVRPAYIRDKATGLYYKLAVQGLPGSGSEGGVSDHGSLSGLADDDHSQYLNNARGDARYSLIAHTHTGYAATLHTHLQSESHNSPDTDTATTALHHTIGTGANQAAAGNHTHAGYAATSHTHTQAQSHNSPDTDASPTALHHTIGTGANQAAAGTHTHTAAAVGAEPAGAVATHAATAGHELLSTTTPAALGTAAVGVGNTTARADHIHAMPTAVNVGAEPAGAITTHVGAANPHTQYLLKSGGALTGAVTAAADPTAALGLATKQYVDLNDRFFGSVKLTTVPNNSVTYLIANNTTTRGITHTGDGNYVVSKTGLYVASVTGLWSTSVSGFIQWENTAGLVFKFWFTAANAVSAVAFYQLSAGDTLACSVLQTSGSAVTFNLSGSNINIVRVSEV